MKWGRNRRDFSHAFNSFTMATDSKAACLGCIRWVAMHHSLQSTYCGWFGTGKFACYGDDWTLLAVQKYLASPGKEEKFSLRRDPALRSIWTLSMTMLNSPRSTGKSLSLSLGPEVLELTD